MIEIQIGAVTCDEVCLARAAVYIGAFVVWIGLCIVIGKLGERFCNRSNRKGG